MLLFSPFSLYSYKDNVVNDIDYSFSELGSIYFPCLVTLFMPASKHVNGLYIALDIQYPYWLGPIPKLKTL